MMPFELSDEYDTRYRVPASLTPEQLHVGGDPDARAVRGYGSEQWFTLGDGIREAAVLTFSGFIATDRNYAQMDTMRQELEDAVSSAAQLIEVDADGLDVAVLELRGALPVQYSPTGVDGTLLHVRVHLLPASADWEDP